MSYQNSLCNCGKSYEKSKKFSIYNKDFCSIECLGKFKTEVEEKERKKEEERIAKLKTVNRFQHCDNGGSCC